MKPLIGVLLNQRILKRGVRGQPTFEKLALYAKAARELDVDVVFFDTTGVRIKRKEVIGYVPREGGKWQRRVVPLPKVVHKRGLFRRSRDRRVIKRLTEQSVYVFNPDINWDKYEIHKILQGESLLRPYLPETVLARRENYAWFRQQLLDGHEVFVKSRKGSLGLGIARVYRIGPDRYRYQSRSLRKSTTLRGVWNLACRGGSAHMLQTGIQLMEDGGRRVDFRVPVQRDGDGKWNIPGIAAKRAERLPFLTNLARGASVHDGREMLIRNFGAAPAKRIIDEMLEIATVAAQTLNAHHANVVDLGFDIGIDKQGHPYIIEANRRDLRVLLARSGQHDANAMLFKNPIAYGRYVLEHAADFAQAK